MTPGTKFFGYFGPVSRFWGLNLRPQVVGCFLRDLGVNILRNMMVRYVENIVNTDVFSKSQIFDFFDILGSSGRPGTLF